MDNLLYDVINMYYIFTNFLKSFIFGYSNAKAVDIIEGKAILDSIISLFWTVTSGALALVGIIGGLVSVGFQRQVEGVQKAYEELFELKRYKYEYLNLEIKEQLIASQNHIRKGFLKYQEKVHNIESEIDLFCDQRFRKIVFPLIVLWVSGMILQIFRWYRYGQGDLGVGLLFVIQSVLLVTLYLIIKGVNTIVQSLKDMSRKLPTLETILDVGVDGDIPSFELMLDTAIVTASIPSYNLENEICFKIYYAVSFYNYTISLDVWFLDGQGNMLVRLPEEKSEIKRDYQKNNPIDMGGMDVFIFKIPDNATDFIINHITYLSSSKPYGLVDFKSQQTSIKSVEEKHEKFVEVRQLWSNSVGS